MKTYTLSLAIGLMIISGAIAGDAGNTPAPGACKEVQTCGAPDSCANCGSRGCCEKYCRVVCEMKEVKKTVWVVKCEDFCPLMPRCPLNCDECCDSCGKEGCNASSCEGSGKNCNPCASLEERNYVPPKCGKVREKKMLEKKEITCKIPSYKCVVVYACANCSAKLNNGGKTESQPPVNPAPSPAPKTTIVAPLPPVAGAF